MAAKHNMKSRYSPVAPQSHGWISHELTPMWVALYILALLSVLAWVLLG